MDVGRWQWPGGSALERELLRKERALAEAAALLVLKKKVTELWVAEDDATPDASEP